MRSKLRNGRKGMASLSKEGRKFDPSVVSNACTGISFLLALLGLVYLSSKGIPFLIVVLLFPVMAFAHGKLLMDAMTSGYKKLDEYMKSQDDTDDK